MPLAPSGSTEIRLLVATGGDLAQALASVAAVARALPPAGPSLRLLVQLVGGTHDNAVLGMLRSLRQER